jgi:hypothetical protein
MSRNQATTPEMLTEVTRFVTLNGQVDWRTFSLGHVGALRALCSLEENEPEQLLLLLRAYQRVLLVLPEGEERRAVPLMADGLSSALRMAGLSQEEFLERWGRLFPGERALGEVVYRNAVARRGRVALAHVERVQADEPHYRAARFR